MRAGMMMQDKSRERPGSARVVPTLHGDGGAFSDTFAHEPAAKTLIDTSNTGTSLWLLVPPVSIVLGAGPSGTSSPSLSRALSAITSPAISEVTVFDLTRLSWPRTSLACPAYFLLGVTSRRPMTGITQGSTETGCNGRRDKRMFPSQSMGSNPAICEATGTVSRSQFVHVLAQRGRALAPRHCCTLFSSPISRHLDC